MMRVSGFTLVESMITVAVIAVLASVAAPSFVTSIDKAKTSKTADLISNLVVYAKSEAVNKNKFVYLTFPANAICVSSTQKDVAGHTCDIRNESSQEGISLTLNDADNNSELVFDKVYGFPDSTANLVVSTLNSNKTVSVSVLGITIVL